MKKVPEVKGFCDRCLKTQRWHGNITLMIIDASFNSIGLNYFHSVVPKVEMFRLKFVQQNTVKSLGDLKNVSQSELEKVWKNGRSWYIAKTIATYLAQLANNKKMNDKEAFRLWAKNSVLIGWNKNPLGKINGVGINTYQYLRMMGGIDTVMPDKIVKRVINTILIESGLEPVTDDIEFIQTVEKIAIDYGYRPIELCWMTWLIQSENNLIRIEKYKDILSKI